jgi:hypothetical protein
MRGVAASLILAALVVAGGCARIAATAIPATSPTPSRSVALPTLRPTPTPVPLPTRAVVDPDALYLLPRGSLKGQLVDDAGKRFAPGDNWDVHAIGDVGGYEPDGGVGIATNPDGSFFIDRLAEMGWRIEIVDRSGDIVGTAHVDVEGGLQASVEVEVSA